MATWTPVLNEFVWIPYSGLGPYPARVSQLTPEDSSVSVTYTGSCWSDQNKQASLPLGEVMPY